MAFQYLPQCNNKDKNAMAILCRLKTNKPVYIFESARIKVALIALECCQG